MGRGLALLSVLIVVVGLATESVLGIDAGPPVEVELPDKPDWWAVDNYVVDQLLSRERGPWVSQILDEPMPDDAVALMVRLNVLVRDGQYARARSTIDALEKSRPWLGRRAWYQIGTFLIYRDDELARYLIEVVPSSRPVWGFSIVRRLLDEGSSAPAWTFDQIEQWLNDRERSDPGIDGPIGAESPADMPVWPGDLFDPGESSPVYWFAIRVDLYRQEGRAHDLLEQTARELRSGPDSPIRMMRYIQMCGAVDPPQSPEGILDVVKPSSAYVAHRLGETLSVRWPVKGVAMFEKSLTMPFGDEDEAALRYVSKFSVLPIGLITREGLERSLRRETRVCLAETYQKMGQPDKAQPLIEALATESGQAIPLSLASLAGHVQAATGARVIESRIVEQETAQGDAPEYWECRARYFRGRGEQDQAEAAYRKAIELAPLDESLPSGQSSLRRSRTVGDYVSYLCAHDRRTEAVELIWHEMDSVPPENEYAWCMVSLARGRDRDDWPLLTVENERLWRWLAARSRWDHLEKYVLLSISDHARPDHEGDPDLRDRVWARALPLVQDTHPSRAATLGWVMTRHDATARSVPLLTDALARLDDEKARHDYRHTLFEAYLQLDDAARAETLWPQLRQRLTSSEDGLKKMADAADRSGDADRAARLRATLANLDHRWAPATHTSP
jgi:tetratricopeptide (TPR) repeat protein